MNVRSDGKEWILSSNFLEAIKINTGKTVKIKSSFSDMVAEGYQPNFTKDGVLCSWKDSALGLWDVPTLNNMVFPKELWEALLENPLIKVALESKCLWGEGYHADRDEVRLPEVAIRVNNFRVDEDNLVLGDIDVMDTPAGLACYTLSKSGRIGTSTRGFGTLDPIGQSGLSVVNIENYIHICWDAVALPAVPACMLDTEVTKALSRDAIGSVSDRLREMMLEAVKTVPTNSSIRRIASALERDTVRKGKYYSIEKAITRRK